ncbi:right-handed parallel beta-helix repeat-containing protein [Streptomyces sp. R35]|uniref:Right-handed parallel beta-helix repeat-containing protein n=1 Tax=Streptomyces sp. R35 TaxID=3238630 RepID=A0AB39STT1_9ACTN
MARRHISLLINIGTFILFVHVMKRSSMKGALKRSEKLGTRGALAVLSVLATVGALVGIAPAAHTASTLVVPRDYRTIQAAVDAAASGDTILVRGGTYTEEVVVSGKDLHLKGVGKGSPVIKSPTTLTPFAQDVRHDVPVTSVVRIADGAHVHMSGFTVTGPVPCGQLASGITALQSSSLDLSRSRVIDMLPAPSCPADQAFGRGVTIGLPDFIQVDGTAGSPASGRITHVRVTRYQTDGFNLNGPSEGTPSQVVAKNNVVTGGAQIPTVQAGIVVGGAVATVTGNLVSHAVCTFPGCGGDPTNEYQSSGIAVIGAASGTQISQNRVSDTDIGIYQVFSPNCCQISRNRLTDNRFFGIAIQDGDGTTAHNEITGGQVGIGVIADAVDTTGILRGDRIRRTYVAPVREIQCCGFRATAVVKPS